MCCFSQKTIKRCSKCLCFSSLLLFLSMSAIAMLGVMVSKTEMFDKIVIGHDYVDSVEFIDLSKGSNMILSLTVIMICLTFIAILLSWLTKLTMSKSSACACITVFMLILLAIIFLVIGSVLAIPGTLGDEFI